MISGVHRSNTVAAASAHRASCSSGGAGLSRALRQGQSARGPLPELAKASVGRRRKSGEGIGDIPIATASPQAGERCPSTEAAGRAPPMQSLGRWAILHAWQRALVSAISTAGLPAPIAPWSSLNAGPMRSLAGAGRPANAGTEITSLPLPGPARTQRVVHPERDRRLDHDADHPFGDISLARIRILTRPATTAGVSSRTSSAYANDSFCAPRREPRFRRTAGLQMPPPGRF
jgi:hypothetical protein